MTSSPYTLLIGCLEPSLLFLSVLDIPFLYLPAGYAGSINTECFGSLFQYFPVDYTIFRHCI